MDANLEEMLENDKQNVNDRISNLEKRVQNQDNEIILLRSSLADILRRVQQIENTPKTTTTRQHTASQSVSAASVTSNSSFANSTAKKPSVPSVRASTASTGGNKTAAVAPRLNKASSQTNLKSAQSSSNGNVSTVSAAPKQASNTKSSSKTLTITATKDKETSYQYNSETSSVKLFLRGRPITFNLPETGEESNEFDLDRKVKAPKEHLRLEWVYGYRGKDCRSNLYQLATGEIIYFIASAVVLFNIDEHSQRHYLGHTDDIKCLAIHPDGVTIATGQVAGHDPHEGKPHIRIWDSVNLNTIKTIGLHLPAGDTFQNSIACLSFSKADGGQQLCVVDDGGERVISVWNWNHGTKLASTKCYGDLVFAAEFHPSEKNVIVSCGKQHVFFWNLDGSQLTKKAGTFDKVDKPKYILCIGFLPTTGEVITGDSEGNLLIWNYKDGKITKQIKDAHEGGVFSILVLPAGGDVAMVTGGGKDGKLVEWNLENQKTGRTLQVPEVNGTCRFISQGNGNLYLVGTTKNCILKGNFDVNLTSVMSGHVEELWGLAVNPREATFLTCGNDRNVFYWDLLTHSVLWSLQVDTDHSGAHCAHFHPNANVVAIGHTKNKWSVYDLNERKCVFAQIEGTEQIECIQYSPNGQYLAAGSRDNSIYIYNVNEDATKYIRIGRCQGHSSFITHIDWSADSEYLMSNSGDYEILFWNAATCKQITQAHQVRNVEWATRNCTLTPSTFGIWGAVDVEKPAHQNTLSPTGIIHLDGTDINSSCISQGKNLIACGDDNGRVNIYSYPTNSSKCEKRAYHGHSSHVTSVKFVNNDTRIISTGGNDMSIFEWSVLSE